MPRELRGRRVLIVDDVSASGDTLELARTLAQKAGARWVRTAVLVRRLKGYSPDFAAVRTDDLVVFPWDYRPLLEEGRIEVDGKR
jgi:hypoxanthine phosphoribosyltransferase